MRGIEVGGMHACYEESGVPYMATHRDAVAGGWVHRNAARARSKTKKQHRFPKVES